MSDIWKKGFLLLLILLSVTYLVQQVALWHAGQHPEQWSAWIQHRLEKEVATRFLTLQQKLVQRGETVAGMPEIRALLLHPDSIHAVQAADALKPVRSDAYQALEAYNLTPRLLIWKGTWLPPDDAMRDPTFLDTVQTGRIQDGDIQWGVAIWVPVHAGDSLLGGIRVASLFTRSVPFRNRYLKPYSVEERWNKGAYWPFQLRPYADTLETAGFVLQGIDGRPLLRVLPQPFAPDALRLWVKRRLDNVLVLWVLLLALWLSIAILQRIRKIDFLRAGGYFLLVLVTLRYVLVVLDLPDRWFKHIAYLQPFSDPAWLASNVGWGLVSSPASFFLTALFVVIGGCWIFLRWRDVEVSRVSWLQRLYWALGLWLLVQGAYLLIHGAVQDSTLDFFSLEGLLPESVLAVVLLSALLLIGGVLLGGIALSRLWLAFSGRTPVSETGALVVLFLLALLLPGAPVLITMTTGAVIMGLAFLERHRRATAPAAVFFTLRLLVPGVLLTSILTYGFLEGQMIERQNRHIQEQLASFKEGRDVRVLFALEQLRDELRSQQELIQAFRMVHSDVVGALRLDDLAGALYQRSMLTDLSQYMAEVLLLKSDLHPVGYFGTSREPSSESAFLRYVLPLLQEAPPEDRIEVRPVVSGGLVSRMIYLALYPIRDGKETLGWVCIRLEPLQGLVGDVPFPEVFSPEGTRESWYHRLSLALFYRGTLKRVEGAEFGRYRLPAELLQRVQETGNVSLKESLQGVTYRSYYEVDEQDRQIIYGAHIPQLRLFERLFYLFRLTLLGLLVGLMLYLMGIPFRYRRGLLPAPHTRFQDRLLEAFLGVGLVALVVAGTMGIRHVNEESRGAVASWHRRNLQRVEEFLVREAREGESPADVLERIPVRQLRERLELDMNVFRRFTLSQTTRPSWFEQRLLSPRLPLSVYEDLFLKGYRQSIIPARIGGFSYLAGYQVLLDARERPQLAVEVLTLPELERLLEERARTLASFLSALFVLFLLFITTGVVLARTLSRPLARIKAGLQAIASGAYPVELPVDSRDEVGELAQAFNEMQVELEESRRQLARQQREQAWQEMARQVAHEIKNPLTPMKLSIQHLRRTFQELEGRTGILPEWRAFRQRFLQITDVLMQQIDALTRIANAFSQYGRLPQRRPQSLDLNEVIRQTVALWESDHPEITIELDLEPGGAWVTGDPEELRRVYINLVKNALQAMPEGGTLRIRTWRTDAEIVSTVEDTGIGIPEELQGRIFEPHFSTRTSGTGIGLAITRQIVETMGGRIHVQSQEGKGTRFYLHFPFDSSKTSGESDASSITS